MQSKYIPPHKRRQNSTNDLGDASRLIRSAQRLLKDRAYDRAYEFCERAIAKCQSCITLLSTTNLKAQNQRDKIIIQNSEEKIAESYRIMGHCYAFSEHDFYKAEAFYNKAKIQLEAIVMKTDSRSSKLMLAHTYNEMGTLYKKQAQYTTAIKYYKISLSLYQEYHRDRHPHMAKIHKNLGLIMFRLKQGSDALTHYQCAIDNYGNLAKKSDNFVSKYDFSNLEKLADIYNFIANVYSYGGIDREKAVTNYQQAIAIIERTQKPIPWHFYNNFAVFYFLGGDFKKALEMQDKALEASSSYSNSLERENRAYCQQRFARYLTQLSRVDYLDEKRLQQYYWKALEYYLPVLKKDFEVIKNNLGSLNQYDLIAHNRLLFRVASIYRLQGKRLQSAELYHERAKVFVNAIPLIALVYLKESYRDYKACSNANKQCHSVLCMQAEIYYKQLRYTAAVAVLKKAMKYLVTVESAKSLQEWEAAIEVQREYIDIDLWMQLEKCVETYHNLRLLYLADLEKTNRLSGKAKNRTVELIIKLRNILDHCYRRFLHYGIDLQNNQNTLRKAVYFPVASSSIALRNQLQKDKLYQQAIIIVTEKEFKFDLPVDNLYQQLKQYGYINSNSEITSKLNDKEAFNEFTDDCKLFYENEELKKALFNILNVNKPNKMTGKVFKRNIYKNIKWPKPCDIVENLAENGYLSERQSNTFRLTNEIKFDQLDFSLKLTKPFEALKEIILHKLKKIRDEQFADGSKIIIDKKTFQFKHPGATLLAQLKDNGYLCKKSGKPTSKFDPNGKFEFEKSDPEFVAYYSKLRQILITYENRRVNSKVLSKEGLYMLESQRVLDVLARHGYLSIVDAKLKWYKITDKVDFDSQGGGLNLSDEWQPFEKLIFDQLKGFVFKSMSDNSLVEVEEDQLSFDGGKFKFVSKEKLLEELCHAGYLARVTYKERKYKVTENVEFDNTTFSLKLPNYLKPFQPLILKRLGELKEQVGNFKKLSDYPNSENVIFEHQAFQYYSIANNKKNSTYYQDSWLEKEDDISIDSKHIRLTPQSVKSQLKSKTCNIVDKSLSIHIEYSEMGIFTWTFVPAIKHGSVLEQKPFDTLKALELSWKIYHLLVNEKTGIVKDSSGIRRVVGAEIAELIYSLSSNSGDARQAETNFFKKVASLLQPLTAQGMLSEVTISEIVALLVRRAKYLSYIQFDTVPMSTTNETDDVDKLINRAIQGTRKIVSVLCLDKKQKVLYQSAQLKYKLEGIPEVSISTLMADTTCEQTNKYLTQYLTEFKKLEPSKLKTVSDLQRFHYLLKKLSIIYRLQGHSGCQVLAKIYGDSARVFIETHPWLAVKYFRKAIRYYQNLPAGNASMLALTKELAKLYYDLGLAKKANRLLSKTLNIVYDVELDRWYKKQNQINKKTYKHLDRDIYSQLAYVKSQILALKYSCFRALFNPDDEKALTQNQNLISDLIVKTHVILDQVFMRFVNKVIYKPNKLPFLQHKFPCESSHEKLAGKLARNRISNKVGSSLDNFKNIYKLVEMAQPFNHEWWGKLRALSLQSKHVKLSLLRPAQLLSGINKVTCIEDLYPLNFSPKTVDDWSFSDLAFLVANYSNKKDRLRISSEIVKELKTLHFINYRNVVDLEVPQLVSLKNYVSAKDKSLSDQEIQTCYDELAKKLKTDVFVKISNLEAKNYNDLAKALIERLTMYAKSFRGDERLEFPPVQILKLLDQAVEQTEAIATAIFIAIEQVKQKGSPQLSNQMSDNPSSPKKEFHQTVYFNYP